MQDKVLKMALIGVGNMGKKYAQMIVSGEVLHMKLAAVVIRRDEQIAWGKTLVNVDGQPVQMNCFMQQNQTRLYLMRCL